MIVHFGHACLQGTNNTAGKQIVYVLPHGKNLPQETMEGLVKAIKGDYPSESEIDVLVYAELELL